MLLNATGSDVHLRTSYARMRFSRGLSLKSSVMRALLLQFLSTQMSLTVCVFYAHGSMIASKTANKQHSSFR